MEEYNPGDTIVHTLVPFFEMPVLETAPCEVDSARPEPHLQYRVIDMMGNEDWLCAYDVKRVRIAER